ncbi:SDR family NAD(P)-dependent oxidoreductase [Paenibacillus donghaensis]|uniref:Uncharacterized protein n=1 Tax=Paenibacillus donghaensis TaxID=414771 RepID=A0A2Z2KDK3_9BACL|nr:SDR family NAD(P)-dependent oxidoreductase [Paenibacillus donghaensis]ASA24064.1 hypothetical protein B9T62_26750 [Paenibacillus donghaensis]
MDLANKHISLVTGAGTGLGRATAVEFAKEGSMVVLVGRRKEKLEEVSALISQSNGQSFLIPADVTCLEDVNKLRDQVLTRFGRLDWLINNAGVAGKQITIDVTII